MRLPLTPAEFDAACREMERRCPWLTQTSGRRSIPRNREVGGNPASKHLIGMARDYVAAAEHLLHAAAEEAVELGLWALVHDKGSGNHLHVQGLPTGPPEPWWLQKYGQRDEG